MAMATRRVARRALGAAGQSRAHLPSCRTPMVLGNALAARQPWPGSPEGDRAMAQKWGRRAALAAAAVGLAAAGVASAAAEPADDVLRDELKARLEGVRKERQSSPSVRIGKVDATCRAISFVVAAPGAGTAALAALVGALQGEHRLVLRSDEEGALGVVFGDGSGSVALGPGPRGRLELTLFKQSGKFTAAELDGFVAAYERGAFTSHGPKAVRTPRGPFGGGAAPEQEPPSSEPLARLEQLGAVVYDPEAAGSALDWSALAGYEHVHREVEDTILLGLKHPDEYDLVTRKTRASFESNRPRAVLFEGPPGTGKTTTARIVASLAGVPMVYIPIESVMSKWFGESESRLSEMLKLCDELGSAIVFLDEIDSLATSRDGSASMHEATRRLLSVLLRTLEGFEERSSAILIAATNRKEDLDAALVSRFDVSVPFPLPGVGAREAIFARYAKQLPAKALAELAELAVGFSGRDIKDACKHAERRWVSQFLRSGDRAKDGALEIPAPELDFYREAVRQRLLQVRG